MVGVVVGASGCWVVAEVLHGARILAHVPEKRGAVPRCLLLRAAAVPRADQLDLSAGTAVSGHPAQSIPMGIERSGAWAFEVGLQIW